MNKAAAGSPVPSNPHTRPGTVTMGMGAGFSDSPRAATEEASLAALSCTLSPAPLVFRVGDAEQPGWPVVALSGAGRSLWPRSGTCN